MQDVAVKMVSRLHTLRDAEAFRPWLRRITINVCRGAARGARPALRLDRVTGPEGGAGAGPEDERPSVPEDAAGRDAAAHVLEQASTLPVEYREPLLLRCVQSLTYQQIGAILDLPVTTIETRLARARRMLREEIGEDV